MAWRYRTSLTAGRVSIIALGLLLAGAHVALADPVLEARPSCVISDQKEARRLADALFEQGSYQRAGECYQTAGEYARADRAFLKAVEPAGELTARRLSDQGEQAKALLRQVKQTFSSHAAR
jgi:hypothetical protein